MYIDGASQTVPRQTGQHQEGDVLTAWKNCTAEGRSVVCRFTLT